jgi:ADP-ribosyl-[dinitrogen reductase] hydrolase
VARTPLRNSHWIEPGRLLVGEHPSGTDARATRKRIARLVDAGIDCFLDLTEPGEIDSYEPQLAGVARGREIAYLRRPLPDHDIPGSHAVMHDILATLDEALAGGRTVYMHCRAGIGRTNMVAGCWMAGRHGAGAEALEELNRRWRANGRSRNWPVVPETPAQTEFVRGWPHADPAAPAGPVAAAATPTATDLRDRVRGMLLGLAAGEAIFHAIHGLPVGAWADKTAMALCLAESLVSQDGPDGADQVARYREWQRAGVWSSTGTCIGISAATSRALAAAQWSGNPYSGSHDPAHADAEPLARIGPAVAWYHDAPAPAIEAAVNAARVTHQAPLTLDAVRLLSALISGALAGEGRHALLSADFTPDAEAYDPGSLRAPLRDVAAGAWRGRRPRRLLRGKYAAVAALESALAAFEGAEGFAQVLAAAASRPGDAVTAAAIAGQLAGAHYGAGALPRELRAGLARADEIEALADRLVDAAPRARNG